MIPGVRSKYRCDILYYYYYNSSICGYHILGTNTSTESVETPTPIIILGAVHGERQEIGSSLCRPPIFHSSSLGGLPARQIVTADSWKIMVACPWLELRSKQGVCSRTPVISYLPLVLLLFALSPSL